MFDIILDTFLDSIKLLPFLFVAFLFIELLEHKFSDKTKDLIKKSDRFGPLFGSILGAFPQCGFSVMATNLYVTRIVSLGTLISIYLSTSDEMLPIMLSKRVDFSIVLKFLLIKVIIGMICGFIIDLVYRKKYDEKDRYCICDVDHCHCEESIVKSSIKHTFKILLFIFIISFILNIVMEYVGNDVLTGIFRSKSILSLMLASLVGLIPNCGASVAITELYLSNIISFSSAVSGLLTGSGVALLVLFRTNKNIKENIQILFIVYILGVISGLLIELLNFF